MTSRDFCYWLQGYLEISKAETEKPPGQMLVYLTEAQLVCVMKHLAMVFKHEIDPSMGTTQEQTVLNHLHGAGSLTAGGGVARC